MPPSSDEPAGFVLQPTRCSAKCPECWPDIESEVPEAANAELILAGVLRTAAFSGLEWQPRCEGEPGQLLPDRLPPGPSIRADVPVSDAASAHSIEVHRSAAVLPSQHLAAPPHKPAATPVIGFRRDFRSLPSEKTNKPLPIAASATKFSQTAPIPAPRKRMA